MKGCISHRATVPKCLFVKQYVSFEKNYLAFDIVFIRFKAFQKCFLRYRQTRFRVISKSFISLSKGWLLIHDVFEGGRGCDRWWHDRIEDRFSISTSIQFDLFCTTFQVSWLNSFQSIQYCVTALRSSTAFI